MTVNYLVEQDKGFQPMRASTADHNGVEEGEDIGTSHPPEPLDLVEFPSFRFVVVLWWRCAEPPHIMFWSSTDSK